MAVKSVTPILNVSSIGDSFAWFEALGWRRGSGFVPQCLGDEVARQPQGGEIR